MGTCYAQLGISSGMIGGTIATSVVHDIVVNDLGLQGFPGIGVERSEGGFQIVLSFEAHAVSFEMTESEAKAAVKHLRGTSTHYRPIFDRVQEGLAKLEGLSRP